MKPADFPMYFSFGNNAAENRRIKMELMITIESMVFLGSKSVQIKTTPARNGDKARVELDVFDAKKPRFNHMG